ncbi:LysR family transcriptional regulator [Lentibacillus cibarius]|uniref:LysR family transcriptional regulator n=1 Tax=Lentibacillus cibarius TaxID=2583219 RepID=A0A5S3QIE5_9BACI|nr:LysR family transcriptional regulator [Lentibacillus cibarius]TMN21682.1 LysR family transcriptional regulator [Lentibacillus cibarius]
MNIENFRMFCRVVEKGSITKAAELGYVTQPAVTKQIRQLEDSYGTTLFDREEGALKLTKAGELLYPYAKELLAVHQEAHEKMQEHLGKRETSLYVGASLTIGEYLLPALIRQFKQSYPLVQFHLSIGNTPLMLEKLEKKAIDMALVEGVVPENVYKQRKFADDELILVTASNHRWGNREAIQINEIPEEKMIWREKESGTRQIVEESLNQHHVLEKIENAMELGSKSAVEEGLGTSILPKLTVQKELAYNTLREIPIKDFHLTRDFWMVQKNRRYEKEIVTDFAAFLLGGNGVSGV